MPQTGNGRATAGRITVVVGGSYWALNGVNVFSVNLVRGLQQEGLDAHILLTEEQTNLISISDAPMQRPDDVPIVELPVGRRRSWGAHWGAMIRYLEDHAPCIYIPNSDWRHSCVSPVLSDAVRIIGVVHSDDPLHYDHVRRLGRYWDAIVTTSPVIARKTIDIDGSCRDRIQVIPIGVDIPRQPPSRVPRTSGALRVIYPGTLKQHQKRVLDLPDIVRAASRRGLPVSLTIAGGGTDEHQLRVACADLVEQGVIRFLGVVEHSALLRLLEAHDVFIMTSEFEGLPNALIEAMGRGCVPLVTDIESGIPDLVRDGFNGYVVPVGAIEAFADRLELLCHDPDATHRFSQRAYEAVSSGKYHVRDMVESYADLCRRLMDGSGPAGYVRPRGTLNHPPPKVSGIGVFPVTLPYDVAGVGAFPSRWPDYRQFRSEVTQLKHPDQSPLAALIEQPSLDLARLRDVPVIVGLPAWTSGGMGDFAATLVRGLQAAGLNAHVLLTEENSDRVDLPADHTLVPPDLPVHRLPVARSASWGAHWGALIRYLEDRAPCLYLPTNDWRHSCIAPLLSERIGIVGIVHAQDALHRDHVRRLGRYWNVVVVDDETAGRALDEDPALTGRVHVIPYAADDVAEDYLELFAVAVEDMRTGGFHRPPGAFHAPPREVDGIGVFQTDAILPATEDLGIPPGLVREHREFLEEIGRSDTYSAPAGSPQPSPLRPQLARRAASRARLQESEVIVTSPVWRDDGISAFAAGLVRQFRGAGLSAHLLLTEDDGEGTPPADIPVQRLPVAPDAGWGARWGALIRYLEDRGPCLYLPNHDWHHSGVAPLLSDRVAIVGIVHADDSLNRDHVKRLGRYWNAIIAHNIPLAEALAQDPALAARVRFVSYGDADLAAADYLGVFETAFDELESGAFHRPTGPLQPPAPMVAGVSIFAPDTIRVADVTMAPTLGLTPREVDDYRAFFDQVSQLRDPAASPLQPQLARRAAMRARLQACEVIVASPAWRDDGMNRFAATLVRQLRAGGVSAQLLLTEDDGEGMPPADIPVHRLPVAPTAGWGARWGAMVRYLEDRGPCVYLPNHDWRHSCVAPLLSDRVAIVGVVHADDPLHRDHAARLGRYWNAIVAHDAPLAEVLAREPALAARVRHVACREADLGADYQQVFETVLDDLDTGAFQRPAGPLHPPAPIIAGLSVFPSGTIQMADAAAPLGLAPREVDDYRAFFEEVSELRDPTPSPLQPQLARRAATRARLQAREVIVASPAWTEDGINLFAATLVRQFRAAGLSAQLLLTEEETEYVTLPDQRPPRPSDIPWHLLPVARTAGWGAHWGAMVRYLEERAPCIYLPNHDWRHSCVAPLLSDRVAIVGIVHADDPFHCDHVRRLGRYWNAIVAHDAALADALAQEPALAARVRLVSYREADLGADYMQVFETVLEDLETGAFQRPKGLLQPPPREVAGISVFPVDLAFHVEGVGSFPREDPDFAQFQEQIGSVGVRRG